MSTLSRTIDLSADVHLEAPLEITTPFGETGGTMHVRCPHCHNPVVILDDSSFKDILCSTCGSSFSLVGDAEATETARMASKRIGQFELVEQLGVGAFGTVWKAKDTQLDRIVAIKIPRKGQLSDAETEQFLREARAAAQLRHPNIVSVHEVGKSDGSVYIVSDYVEGADLKEWMRGQPLPPKEAAELCAKIAEALHHAHEQGVIHRDLKPGNIMMDLKGQPHIMDFGLAKRESGEMTMTVDGAILGTPAYMSPEQAKGEGHRADRRSDVYSLGTMLFEMLTGELPFRGEKRILIVSILTQEPPKLRRLNPRVPKDLETICLKCMEKEAERRYPTAHSLADDLRRYAIGEPIAARPIGTIETAWRWSRRHPAGAGLLAASIVALALVVGMGIALSYQRRLETANTQLVRAQYSRNVSEALAAWQDNEVGRAARLLTACPSSERHWEWHYVNNLFQRGVVTLADHEGWIRDLAFSPTGDKIASAGTDNTLRVWNAQKGTLHFTKQGHLDVSLPASFSSGIFYGFYCTAFSPDGTLVVGGTGNELAQDGDGRRQSTIFVWNAQTGALIRKLEGHEHLIDCVAFSPDGKTIASGSKDETIRLWATATGEQIRLLEGHTGRVSSVQFSPDGTQIVSASDDGSIRVWHIESGDELQQSRRSLGIQDMVLNPSGTEAVTVSGHGTVTLWSVPQLKRKWTIDAHAKLIINSVDFTLDGSRIITSGADHLVKVWDASDGSELRSLKGHLDVVMCARVSPDGERIVSGGRDGLVKIWDGQVDQDARFLEEQGVALDDYSNHAVDQLGFSRDGKVIACRSDPETVTIWDVADGRKVVDLKAKLVRDVSFSPDGQRIVVAGANPSVHIFDAINGSVLMRLTGHTHRTSGVTFSPDGELVATGGDGVGRTSQCEVKVWDSRTGQEVATLSGHQWSVRSVAFSPNGQYLAAASWDTSVKLWEVGTWKEIVTFTQHTYVVSDVAFSFDSSRIVSGSWDKTAIVWRPDTGEVELTLNADSWVNSVDFSPDGRRVLAACQPGTLKLWDTFSGEETLTVDAHRGPVSSAAFSADGRLIASRSTDKTIKIWDAGTSEFISD